MSDMATMEAKLDRILALLEQPKPRVTLSRKPKGVDYSPQFEEAWKLYPKRAGNNPKLDAYHAWNARLRDGETTFALKAGVERYRAYCAATGSTGSQFVMQAATFFGPSRPWECEWTLPEVKALEPKTNEDWSKFGREKGINARTGESWNDYKQRLRGAMV